MEWWVSQACRCLRPGDLIPSEDPPQVYLRSGSFVNPSSTLYIW